jgi:hypothetical protein
MLTPNPEDGPRGPSSLHSLKSLGANPGAPRETSVDLFDVGSRFFGFCVTKYTFLLLMCL